MSALDRLGAALCDIAPAQLPSGVHLRNGRAVLVVPAVDYLILDVYSRKIVGFEVHETDSSDHAVDLLRRTALSEGIHTLERKPRSPWRQWRNDEGDDGARHVALVGHQAIVLSAAPER